MKKPLLSIAVLLFGVPAFAASAPEQIDMVSFFDAKSPEEAARKSRIVEAGWELPEEMRDRIPGMDPTDAEVIEVFLDDFINANNGNIWLPFWDLEVSADGPPIMLRRIYNSRDPDPPSEFGRRWSWAFGNRLHRQGDTLTIRDADGSVMTFNRVPNTKDFVSTAAAQKVVEKDGGYFRTMPADSLAERYDRDGFLVERIDALNRKARVKRDSKGRAMGLVAANGRTIDFTLDGMNRIVAAKNQAGQVATFTYDGDRLVASEKSGLTTKYTYDAEDRITGVDFPFGEKLAVSYTEAGFLSELRIGRRVVRARYIIDPSNPVLHGSQITVDGETTKYEFNEVTGDTRMTHPSGNVEVEKQDPTCGCLAETEHSGQKTTYTYDELGRLTRIKTASDDLRWEYGPRAVKKHQAFSGTEKVLEIRFDDFGQPLVVAAPGQPVMEYAYENGHVTQIKTGGVLMRQLQWSPQGDLIGYSDAKTVLEASYDASGYVKELRKTDRVRLEFQPRHGHIVPNVRLTMNWNGATRQALLAKGELRMIFGESVDLIPGKQKASLDGIPGAKYAQMPFAADGQWRDPETGMSMEDYQQAGKDAEAMRQWVIKQYERFANPPGGQPCTRLAYATCRLRKFTACIIPALVGIIPIVGNIGINFEVGKDGKGTLGNDWKDIFMEEDAEEAAEQITGLSEDLAESVAPRRAQNGVELRPDRRATMRANGWKGKAGNRKFDQFIRTWKAGKPARALERGAKAVKIVKGIFTPLKALWLLNDIRKCVNYTNGDRSGAFLSDNNPESQQCP